MRLDTPPVGPVVDPIILANLAEIIFVVQRASTPRELVRENPFSRSRCTNGLLASCSIASIRIGRRSMGANTLMAKPTKSTIPNEVSRTLKSAWEQAVTHASCVFAINWVVAQYSFLAHQPSNLDQKGREVEDRIL